MRLDEPVYHYVVVRRDVEPRICGAQIVHAAGESAAAYSARTGQRLPEGVRSVVLAAADEQELAALAARCESEALTRIVESEGPHAGQLMAIALEPAPRSRTSPSRFLSAVPCWKGGTAK